MLQHDLRAAVENLSCPAFAHHYSKRLDPFKAVSDASVAAVCFCPQITIYLMKSVHNSQESQSLSKTKSTTNHILLEKGTACVKAILTAADYLTISLSKKKLCGLLSFALAFNRCDRQHETTSYSQSCQRVQPSTATNSPKRNLCGLREHRVGVMGG